MLRVRVLSTGYEVLRGYTLDGNAAWLARAATEAGALVLGARTVGDDAAEVERAIAEAAGDADEVLVSGGLGPTEDDRTREALARAMGVPQEHDEAAWALVVETFRRAGREAQGPQRRQAALPRGARALRNPEGTAPGVEARLGSAVVSCLPGPPREMRAVFRDGVLPRWRREGRLEPVAARVLWTGGVPEAEIGVALEDLMRASEPTVGTHPDDGEVAVRILARGPDADARAGAAAGEVRRRLGPAVVSEDEEVRVQHAVVRALHARRATVTTAESVTGGLVARMLVEVPGASDVFRGGFVAYSDEWKHDALGVSRTLLDRHGAVSAEVVLAMAEAALAAGRTRFSVATTGVAGPGPGARGVPQGTAFVAVAEEGRAPRHAALRLATPRVPTQRRVAVAALDLLRRAVSRLA
jgi:nicotinamide-nucleotide amidase